MQNHNFFFEFCPMYLEHGSFDSVQGIQDQVGVWKLEIRWVTAGARPR